MFGDRLMAGHQVLVLGIGVRIPVPEPINKFIFLSINESIIHLIYECIKIFKQR